MSSTIEELTIAYTDDDELEITKELAKEVLTKGAWTTIMYKYQDLNRTSGEFGPIKVSVRRYQKQNGEYKSRSKFNISSEKQARQMMSILEGWFPKDD
jgi:hypothetical protein